MTLFQVDAFTDQPFTGNPAAVCVLEAFPDDRRMQQVALEMNLSETAFLVPRDDVGSYDLRWFTPATEVDLCGHATLASAHVLWDTGQAPADAPLTFHTRSGLLHARPYDGGIAMDFPAEPATKAPTPDALPRALGAEPVYVGSNRMDYLVRLSSEAAVRDLTPDLHLLASIDTRGVIVTASSDTSASDFVSRFFGPRVGVPEDPVTGSAHCCLGPYWQRELGKDALVGRQVSARGGTIRVQMRGDRVDLIGTAVTVLKAELLV
ncbi:MAG: PhzF family phenazine biosynthesis isomerase [Bacteroidetes bacterium]|jgi:PhzF family phenazine biosynthesis protein|nr:PhzF family phenazine biosynthesis isomerase [Bacteroidota bacterium]